MSKANINKKNLNRVIRYKKVSAEQANKILESVECNNPNVIYYSKKISTKEPKTITGRLTEVKITKSHHIGQHIQAVHHKTVGKRKKAIRLYNNAGYLGKRTISSIDGSTGSVNESLSSEIGNLNHQSIRAGRNLQLNQKQAKQKITNQKNKSKAKSELNIKLKYTGSKENTVGAATNGKTVSGISASNNTSYKKQNSGTPFNKSSKAANKQSKIPPIKKKISKSASKVLKKGSKAKKGSSSLVQSVKFSIKAIKGLIAAFGGIAAAFLAFIVIIGAILLMITSPFAILLDDNPKSMRTQINNYYADYRLFFNNSINIKALSTSSQIPSDYDTRNDRVRVIGPSPDIKEVLKLYIARNSEDPDGDVLIDTEEFKIDKFKTAFSDLNDLSGPQITEYTHDEVHIDKDGKKETVTILDYREFIFTQSSETALKYAQRTNMKKDQIEAIIELGNPEFNKAWANLLYGINSFGYLDPGSMPYFNQGDYGNVPYGPGSLASDGCGPTAFAMVVSYLTNKLITPVDILNWCGNDYYGWPDNGTAWSFFPAAAEHYGIDCENNGATFEEALNALRQGKVVINVQRTGIFTGGGHFIVLRGITPDGKILVSDPNGWNADKWGLSIEEYKNKQWEPEQISASGVNYWIFSSDLALGGNPAEQVWLTLRAKGYSEEVVAGIIGNMMAECGGQTLDLDWSIHGYYNGDTYYGLCQWCLLYTPSWFDGCSIQDQLAYLSGDIAYQFNNYGSNYQSGYNYNDFVRATSVDEAAAAFAACYERPGYEFNNYQQRRQNAMKAYNYFHGKSYQAR